MITAVACVPQAPLLLPGVTGGPVAEVEELLAAARAAAREVIERGADEVIVLGGAPATGVHPVDAPDPTGRVAPAPGRPAAPGALPMSLAVGRMLVAAHTEGHRPPLTLQGVDERAPADATAGLGRALAARPGRTALVVAADGSARRGEKAPGHIDPRALEADTLIGKALTLADPRPLLTLDPATSAAHLIAGRAAWQTMAAACAPTTWTPRTLYEGSPFGVAYWVTVWLPAAPAQRHTA
jgi:hypothetical protein